MTWDKAIEEAKRLKQQTKQKHLVQPCEDGYEVVNVSKVYEKLRGLI